MSEVIKNRYEFVILFDVENGNPNGDPDAGNLPRIDPESGYGIVTDVCIKRKIRDRLSEQGYEIFVQSKEKNKDGHPTLYARAEHAGIFKNKEEADIRLATCKKWIDVRSFGQVFAFKGKGKKEEEA